MTNKSKPNLSLYIHWPFCEKKCPYCDFNSHVRPEINQQRWKRALISEIATEFYLYPDRRISSLFFGGGTPSLMEPDTITALLQAVDQYWGLEDNVEITLEANPSSVEKTRFKNFRSAGVNRLSIGAQSFDDKALKFLGRTHTAREVVEALDLARTTFPRYSFDLIYGRPRQSMNSWKEELNKVTHREYHEGNLVEKAGVESIYSERETEEKEFVIVGLVLQVIHENFMLVEVRSSFSPGEELEILPFEGEPITFKTESIENVAGEKFEKTKPGLLVKLPLFEGVKKWNIIRKRVEQ